MKKVIGYILFYVRLTQKGDKLVWSNEQSLVCQGTLGAGRVWSAPKPGSPPVLYFNPSDKPYADTDMDSIVEGGYATVDCLGTCSHLPGGADNPSWIGNEGYNNNGYDDCGVCNGSCWEFLDIPGVYDNSVTCYSTYNECTDCDGYPHGGGYLDDCGVCVGGATTGDVEINSCYGCMNPDAANYDPNATIDDGSCYIEDCRPKLYRFGFNFPFLVDPNGDTVEEHSFYTTNYNTLQDCNLPFSPSNTHRFTTGLTRIPSNLFYVNFWGTDNCAESRRVTAVRYNLKNDGVDVINLLDANREGICTYGCPGNPDTDNSGVEDAYTLYYFLHPDHNEI